MPRALPSALHGPRDVCPAKAMRRAAPEPVAADWWYRTKRDTSLSAIPEQGGGLDCMTGTPRQAGPAAPNAWLQCAACGTPAQEFLPAACKALEDVDVVCHTTAVGQELGYKAADARLPEHLKARPPSPCPLLCRACMS